MIMDTFLSAPEETMATLAPITGFERNYDPDARGERLAFTVDLVGLALAGLLSLCLFGIVREVRRQAFRESH